MGWINKPFTHLPPPPPQRGKHFLPGFTFQWSVFPPWTDYRPVQADWSIQHWGRQHTGSLHPNSEDLIQDHTTGCPNTRAYQNIKMNYFSMHRLLLCTVFCLPSSQVLSLPLALRQSSYDFLDVLLFPPRLCSFPSMALGIFKILVSLSSTIKKSLSWASDIYAHMPVRYLN